MPTRNALLILITITILGSPIVAAEPELSEAIFYVAWYDVGKAALEGLDGVKKVTSGFKGFREINTVTYDPIIINEEEMIAALKAAGTYRGRVEKWKQSNAVDFEVWHFRI